VVLHYPILVVERKVWSWLRSLGSLILFRQKTHKVEKKRLTDRLSIKPTNLYSYHAIDELLKYIVVQLDVTGKFYVSFCSSSKKMSTANLFDNLCDDQAYHSCSVFYHRSVL